MFSFLLLVLLLQSSLSVTSQQLLPHNIFILAGQSNMAGRGGVAIDKKTGKLVWDGIVPAQSQPNPSILRLSGGLTWEVAHEPLHADIDYKRINGVGPGMPFANAVLTKVPRFGAVGLVPCAVGGTNVSEWAKGGFLYDQLVRRTQLALQNRGILRAMLWYQGESDTKTREDAYAYKGRIEKFFMDVRADLQHPTIPIIQVALASGEGPYVEILREAQLGISLPNVQCIDAKGLPLEPDRLHLTTLAQVHLGETFADLFIQSLALPTTIHVANKEDDPGIKHDLLRLARKLRELIVLVWINVQRHNELLEVIKKAPSEISEVLARRCMDLTEEFFMHLYTVAQSYHDNPTGQNELNLQDVINSPSLDAACRKIDDLAEKNQWDSTLVLMIIKAWSAAKDSNMTKDEVKDILCHLYITARGNLQRLMPKDIRIVRYLLTIQDPEERLCATKDAFTPGEEIEGKDVDSLYTTPKKLSIRAVLDAYHFSREGTILRKATELMNPNIIEKLEVLKKLVEDNFM